MFQNFLRLLSFLCLLTPDIVLCCSQDGMSDVHLALPDHLDMLLCCAPSEVERMRIRIFTHEHNLPAELLLLIALFTA